MSFRKFSTDLKDQNIKNICLLYGREKYLVDWACDSICDKYINETARQFDLVTLDGNDTTGDRIIEGCETLPILSEKKIVIVKGFTILEGEKSGNIDSVAEEALLKYFTNSSDSTILLITCGEKIDKRRRLFKSVYKNGSVYEFNTLEIEDLKKWIIKRFKAAGKAINQKNMENLIAATGYYDSQSEYTLYNLENDISKLLIHSDGEEIKNKDIRDTVSGNINTDVFQLIEHISKGDKKYAFNMLTDLFLFGENEYGILALLYRQYENVLIVKQMKDNKKGREDIKNALGVKDFLITKWAKIADRYEEKDLKKILISVYETDKRIKTGDMDGRMALELFIATI